MKHPNSYIIVTIALMSMGYFVNIFHVITFSIVGKESLYDLLLSDKFVPDEAFIKSLHSEMVQIQMIGALLGSFLWGYMGDKIGRMSALFTSTLCCTIGLFLSAFLPEFKMLFSDNVLFIYKFLRFMVGFGLAGELGAGVVMVSEVMHADTDDRTKTHGNRILGITIVTAIGVLGGVFGGFINTVGIFTAWKNMYYLGAGMGLALIIFRISVYGSELFLRLKYDEPKKSSVVRGNWSRFFKEKELGKKLLICCMLSLPTWFTLGILLEHPNDYGYTNAHAADVYAWSYFGLSVGCVGAGFLSFYLKSHYKVLKMVHILSILTIFFYLIPFNGGAYFSLKCFLIGVGRSYWCLFVAIIPEYFGTNLRCSATTIAINTVRGLLPIYALFMGLLTTQTGWLSKTNAAFLLSIILFGFTMYVLQQKDFEDSYGKDLDFET